MSEATRVKDGTIPKSGARVQIKHSHSCFLCKTCCFPDPLHQKAKIMRAKGKGNNAIHMIALSLFPAQPKGRRKILSAKQRRGHVV
ncbi:hypothetical protein VTK73DRAFT_6184 [Phialemonium thermophilum]|uniref:Uncharacterized protein n=1 Tax=Phialemonium thermophilum TaxID=223376 RepID=A0ABR3V045_9PEZI